MIRLGKISAINYSEGKARVIYEDKDACVSGELPFLALQYNMPQIGELVVVALTDNGQGVILGSVYNQTNMPVDVSNGVFRQEMSAEKDETVIIYNETTKELIIKAPYITLEGTEYDDKPIVTVEQLSNALSDISTCQKDIETISDILKSLEKRVAALESR